VSQAPLVLVAHGSRDRRSAATIRRLAAGVAARWPATVTAAFLEANLPSVQSAVRGLAAHAGQPPVIVPALLTSAYHGRVDLPQVLASCGPALAATPVLGPAEPGESPDPLLLEALLRRLSSVNSRYDGLVLIAAGTSHAMARSTVEGVARALGARLGVPAAVGYASGAPSAGEAVNSLRAGGVTRIAVASYFLAPGRLYDTAVHSAQAAGVVGVAEPLGAAPELVELILARATTHVLSRGDHELRFMVGAST
jgi:sirohydrochlorin ferrochelatase